MILHTGNSKDLHSKAAEIWPSVFPDVKFTDCYPLHVWRIKVVRGITIGQHHFKSGGITLTAEGLPGTMVEQTRHK
jgi:hypothetical protein